PPRRSASRTALPQSEPERGADMGLDVSEFNDKVLDPGAFLAKQQKGTKGEHSKESKTEPPLSARLKSEQADGSATDTEPDKAWLECLREGMCSSEQLAGINIAPRKQIAGDYMYEGDLGFIFAQRGLGKTMLAL